LPADQARGLAKSGPTIDPVDDGRPTRVYDAAREEPLGEGDTTGVAKAIIKRPASALGRPRGKRDLEVEGLWFTLARLPWRTLVFVPSDESASGIEIAAALADVGRRLRTGPVTFLLLSGPMDYAAAGKIVQAMGGRRGHAGQPDHQGEGRLLIAIPSVITEPLGLAVTEVADGIVLCVQRGESKLRQAERTIELVGRDRVFGALML
jgi:hypothetical protein